MAITQAAAEIETAAVEERAFVMPAIESAAIGMRISVSDMAITQEADEIDGVPRAFVSAMAITQEATDRGIALIDGKARVRAKATTQVAVEIDVESLVSAMEERLAIVSKSEPYTISRVPASVRKIDEKLYEPMVISFGQYHHGSLHLQAMEKHKWRYLHDFLSRSTTGATLGDCLTKMKALEKEARSCYSESITLTSDEFVVMMLLDACFIIELALKVVTQDLGDINLGWGVNYFPWDLLLLENQIPFFIIRSLFYLVVGSTDESSSQLLIFKVILSLYKVMVNTLVMQIDLGEIPCEIHHLLHLYHHCFVASVKPSTGKINRCLPLKSLISSLFSPFSSNQSDDKMPRTTCGHPENCSSCVPVLFRRTRCATRLFTVTPFTTAPEIRCTTATVIPCAAELHEAGVRFKKKIVASHFLDITFREGVMEIPFFSMDDSIKPLLANLIVFEQLTCSAQRNMTSFCVLMDCLINTEKDVGLLQRCDVMDNLLGSEDEVARFFNQLCQYAVQTNDHYLSEVFKQVNQYRSSNWPKHRARFCHDYFSNPWSFLSLLAALVLLALTIAQTFFAIYAYFRPP